MSVEVVTFNELGTATKPMELFTVLQQIHRNNLEKQTFWQTKNTHQVKIFTLNTRCNEWFWPTISNRRQTNYTSAHAVSVTVCEILITSTVWLWLASVVNKVRDSELSTTSEVILGLQHLWCNEQDSTSYLSSEICVFCWFPSPVVFPVNLHIKFGPEKLESLVYQKVRSYVH